MAFPNFQAAGAFVESQAGSVSPAWPVHLAGDIGLLIVESCGPSGASQKSPPANLSIPAGFKELPVSPQHDKFGSANEIILQVFWARATSGAMASPTVALPAAADHVRACIVTVRGCGATGNPWRAAKGATGYRASNVALVFPGITTVDADSLIMGICSHGVDSAVAQGSAYTNAGLANIVEQVDSSSTIGLGSGTIVWTGEKAAAGATGDTTATLASASTHAEITLALSSVADDNDISPYIQGYGTPVESATIAVSPVWPPHQAGDIGFLIVESGGWPIVLSVPAGFVEVPDSPRNAGVSSSSGGTQLSVYWKRATTGAETAPTVDFVGDHIKALILTVRGCIASGNPWDVTAGDATTAGTSAVVAIPGDTTTKPNTLILGIASHSGDSTDPELNNQMSNADLFQAQDRMEWISNIGSGSGIIVATGRKLTAGLFGAWAGTLQSPWNQGRVMLALIGNEVQLDLDAGAYNLSGQELELLHDRGTDLDAGAFALTGQDVEFTIGNSFSIELDSGTFTTTGSDIELQRRFGSWERQPSAESTWTKQSSLPLE